MQHSRSCFLAIVILLLLQVLAGCGKKDAEVLIATDATWPPFETVNEQSKELEGYDIDLMNAIAAEEGMKIKWVNVGFDSLLAGMATGQYDAAISVITITDDRRRAMLFSEPYYDAGQLIATRADNADIVSAASLSGKKAGAQLGTTGAKEIEKVAGAQLKTYDEIGQAFMDLMNGQIDAVVADGPLVLAFAAKNQGKIKAVGAPITSERYGIAVKKGGDDLLVKINRGLQRCKDKGVPAQLEDKWVKARR